MTPSIQIPLSGLQAAQKRLAVSANNIANSLTPDYTPQKLVQKSLAEGGVSSEVQDDNADVVAVPSENAATKQLPNISLEEQLENTHIAGYDFKANLKVLQHIDQMYKKLLDIIS